MRVLVRACRRLMPDVGIQIPPNLSDWWLPLVDEGATDLGGLSANGDHISPEHPFPSVHEMRKRLAPRGQALAERLCVYPQYMDSDWLEQGVLDVDQDQVLVVHPAQRLRSPRGAADPPRAGAGRDRAGGRRRGAGRRGAHRPVRRDEARGDRGHAPGRRRAPLRAGRRHRHVRGEPEHQRVQRVHGGLCVLRLRPGPPLARRLRALGGGVPGARARGGGVRRHRDLHAVGHPPGLEARGLRALAAGGQGRGAAPPPPRLLADGGALHGGGPAAVRGVRPAARGRARLHAGHRGRGARRRRAPAHLAEQAPGCALGGDHRGRPRGRACGARSR